MNKTVSVPRWTFAGLLCLIAALALLLGACHDPAESESGSITIAIGVSPTARWSGDKPTDDFLRGNVTHVIELLNGSGYANQYKTITLNPGVTSHTVTGVPLGALKVIVSAKVNGYNYAYGEKEITVASGQNSAPVTMERIEHGIVLSESGTHTFPALAQGYNADDPETLTVHVYNYAANDTGTLMVKSEPLETGSSASDFTILPGDVSAGIAQDSSASFTVTPKPGLAVGTHEAAISVANTEKGISATFNVSVMVNPDVFSVYDTATWNNAITAIENGGNGKVYIINLTGDFPTAGVTANTFGSVTGLNVTISGNHTITLTGTGSLLYIGSGQTVTSKDAHFVGNSSNNTSLVRVNVGTFNMEGGTISGNTSDGYRAHGGGVRVDGTGAVFNMTGGTISGNTASGTETEGGGVYVEGVTFNMTGGTISGNTASQYGGGVSVKAGATFTMSDGTISGNTSSSYGGGGVYIYTANFNMKGGSIAGNIATNGSGGGVYLFYSGTVRLETGTIYGSNGTSNANTANTGASFSGTAERGFFTGNAWTKTGDLSTTNDTIKVVNGEIVP